MKVIATYLLAVLDGNTSPSADEISNILASVGAECEEEKVNFLPTILQWKDLTERIAAGREKLASVQSGGGAAVAYSAGGAAAAAATLADEPNKEEKVEEKEESNDDTGFGLFD